MFDASLTREHIQRRILDNLAWGNLPHHVVEPLPIVVPPPAPTIPLPAPVEEPRPHSRPLYRRAVRKLIANTPLLGRLVLWSLALVLWPLRAAVALYHRLQRFTVRIKSVMQQVSAENP